MTMKITWFLGSVHYWIFQTQNISVKLDLLFPQSILFQKHIETNQSQDTIIEIAQFQFLKWVMLGKLDDGQSTQS